MIIETAPFGPIETNATFVGCNQEKKAVLFDAPRGCFKWYEKCLTHYGLKPSYLLLTHSHWDHIVDAALIHKQFGIPVLVHKEDAANVKNPGADELAYPGSIEGVEPEIISDGQMIIVGNLKIQVIHTPGHTPGGVCYFFDREKILISGDTLFKGTIGRLTLPTAQPERMWKSLKKLAQLPPETVVYPGHMGTTLIKNEPYLENAEEYFG